MSCSRIGDANQNPEQRHAMEGALPTACERLRESRRDFVLGQTCRSSITKFTGVRVSDGLPADFRCLWYGNFRQRRGNDIIKIKGEHETLSDDSTQCPCQRIHSVQTSNQKRLLDKKKRQLRLGRGPRKTMRSSNRIKAAATRQLTQSITNACQRPEERTQANAASSSSTLPELMKAEGSGGQLVEMYHVLVLRPRDQGVLGEFRRSVGGGNKLKPTAVAFLCVTAAVATITFPGSARAAGAAETREEAFQPVPLGYGGHVEERASRLEQREDRVQ